MAWRHGDHIQAHGDTGGVTFYGRSDSTLKPSGVRIGTAEFYSVVEAMEEVADSLAIRQPWDGYPRMPIFVKLQPGYELNEELKQKIRDALRTQALPRHVPALIIEAPDISYTFRKKS